MLHIDISTAAITHVALWRVGLRQFKRHVVTLLGSDEFVDSLHLGGIDEGTLHTDRLCATQIEHVTLTNKLLSACAVEDGLRVDTCRDLEGDTCREVGLDVTRDNRRRRTLGSNHHVDTYGTRQLGNTRDRQVNLLTSRHDQITELVDDHHNVWHVAVTSAWGNLTVDKLLVVLLDVTGADLFQQVIACIHELTEGVERAHHLRDIGDDGISIIVGHLCQEVVDQRIVD